MKKIISIIAAVSALLNMSAYAWMYENIGDGFTHVLKSDENAFAIAYSEDDDTMLSVTILDGNIYVNDVCSQIEHDDDLLNAWIEDTLKCIEEEPN